MLAVCHADFRCQAVHDDQKAGWVSICYGPTSIVRSSYHVHNLNRRPIKCDVLSKMMNWCYQLCSEHPLTAPAPLPFLLLCNIPTAFISVKAHNKPGASSPQHPPHLNADTSLAPVSSLRVVSTHKSPLAPLTSPIAAESCGLYDSRQPSRDHVPDRIASPKTNPLRDGTVLLLCLGELLLRAEGFVGLGGGLASPADGPVALGN